VPHLCCLPGFIGRGVLRRTTARTIVGEPPAPAANHDEPDGDGASSSIDGVSRPTIDRADASNDTGAADGDRRRRTEPLTGLSLASCTAGAPDCTR